MRAAPSNPARHLAAIHVLKGKLGLSDDDYRALLANLTGRTSAKALSDAERGRVRNHMQALATRLGLDAPRQAARGRAATWKADYDRARPLERKVWALWLQLGRDGVVRDTSARALRAFAKRQADVDDLRFCSDHQLHTLIEALKAWAVREEILQAVGQGQT